MSNILLNPQFCLIAITNFCLFLVVSTLNFLPVIIVEMGGTKWDVGMVMGSIGITSFGCLPLLAPLIDRYGRKIFILAGILVIGVSNAGFLLFETYSPLMILIRLIQGIAFAGCFNGCATAIVDLVPEENRAQGIGFFGVFGSLAVSVGPYLGELFLAHWGPKIYFLLLVLYGVVGFLTALMIKEPQWKSARHAISGFFPTAFQNGYMAMMAMAVIFGSGFAAMNTFFPLFAKTLGLQAGIFFVCYGFSLILLRLLLGQLADRVNRDRLILGCLIGFGVTLGATSQISSLYQICLLGLLFGVVQGLSYPAMMARMVDRSSPDNRAVVVALFTGSFGVGINLSVLAWGAVADFSGLPFMFLLGSFTMFLSAAIATVMPLFNKEPLLENAAVLPNKHTHT
jgi:MFS family permease